MVEKFFG